MDHRNSCALMAGVWLLAGLAPAAQSPRGAPAHGIHRVAKPIKDRYIVVLRDDVDPEAMGNEAARLHGGKIRHAYRHALRGFAIHLSEAGALALARDPRVRYVEEDGITQGDEVSTQDPVEPWGLDRVDQRQLPFDARYRYAAEGSGVNVYVVDSGIRVTHQEFEGRAFGAYSAAQDGIPPDQDCTGHGTHVAGIVGGATAGVAKGVTLHSVKALFCDNTGSWADYIEALDWVQYNGRRPAVVNASIGGGAVEAAREAIDRLVASGVTFVGSAGNDANDACGHIPGIADSAIVVGNSMSNDERSSDSNFGRCVDIFAPGAGIRSAAPSDDASYVVRWGTSMAAPHVAGAAALYLQRHPEATPAEVRSAILTGATSGVLTNAGTGSPNLLLFSPYLGDNVAPAISLTSPAASAVVSGTVSISATASDDVELASVTFTAGATTLKTDVSAPYSMSWDTTAVANASHVITAEARDLAGNVTRRSVTVTVANGVIAASAWATTAVAAAGAGTGSYGDGGFVLTGGGTDLWGTADAFEFARRAWTGDGDLVVRVASLTKPSSATFAMAGITFRESLAANARHASLVITTDGKLKFRRRTTAGGATASDGPSAGTTPAPRWLKLSRRANVFSAFVSTDGVAWAPVHTAQAVTMPATVEVGLLALRNGGSGLAQATFANAGVGRVPDGWNPADVGTVNVPGTTTAASGVFTMQAGGTDLWGGRDAFHLAYTSRTGDVEIIARVEGLTAPAGSTFALAAITLRESLDPDARHASLIVTTDGKAKFRRRLTPGGATASDGPSAGAVTVPRWVRLVRQANTITAYMSSDGSAWQRVHTAQTITMQPRVYVGIAGLRNGGTGASTARFTNITVR